MHEDGEEGAQNGSVGVFGGGGAEVVAGAVPAKKLGTVGNRASEERGRSSTRRPGTSSANASAITIRDE